MKCPGLWWSSDANHTPQNQKKKKLKKQKEFDTRAAREQGSCREITSTCSRIEL
ncbi:hypothetical protein MGG_17512 [Pyricularia oryzae 70-15]|uniref:Uncharacterized protein n=3 Tax=Pyricularia oryzae TaxID=318829 RepID=G4NDW4_PYRO7|nr:uncharacterized protein MGG_17512 [Pyricularia oryzae 70-15]EHA49346.1 hypothetical protein MGG_17512 [Pyricularia oryzae 70-15]ELQ34153.1 hypothetical protein OOU_Y34scaffold00793g35 [Pyricularia oryzae Y34]